MHYISQYIKNQASQYTISEGNCATKLIVTTECSCESGHLNLFVFVITPALCRGKGLSSVPYPHSRPVSAPTHSFGAACRAQPSDQMVPKGRRWEQWGTPRPETVSASKPTGDAEHGHVKAPGGMCGPEQHQWVLTAHTHCILYIITSGLLPSAW